MIHTLRVPKGLQQHMWIVEWKHDTCILTFSGVLATSSHSCVKKNSSSYRVRVNFLGAALPAFTNGSRSCVGIPIRAQAKRMNTEATVMGWVNCKPSVHSQARSLLLSKRSGRNACRLCCGMGTEPTCCVASSPGCGSSSRPFVCYIIEERASEQPGH